jgi:hypothetical protein
MIDTNRVGLLLQQKGATQACHRCGQLNFTVLNGFTKFILQSNFRESVETEGASVPVVNVACDNCGAVTSHAVGAQGLKLD